MAVDLSTPCVPWLGMKHPKGYGLAKVRGRRKMAHRIAFESATGGVVPAGMVLDHACHNADTECAGGVSCAHRACVNPEHLEVVTTAENNRRGRVNATKTHCKHGHPFDEANTYIAKRGSRECRACNAARFRARKARRAETA